MAEPRGPDPTYRERRDTFAAEERRLAGVSFRFSLLRGALFLAFAVCLVVILVRGGRPGWGWWAGAGFWLVAFLGVLPRHERIVQRQRRFGELRRINEEGLLRLARDWDGLSLPTLPDPGEDDRAVARDLNLFGRASLSQLLGTAHTPPGKADLGDWLLHPAPPEEIAGRQAAVAELAPEVDLRQQLEVGVRPMEKSPPDLERFLAWAEDEPWLLDRPWLLWLARLLAIATPAALLLWAATPFPIGVFLALASVNIGLGYTFRERTHRSFNRIEAPEGDFQLYAEALERITGRSHTAGELQRIAGDLTVEGQTAHRWMLLLHRRVELSHVRHSSYLYLILQSLLCWDLHVLALLERWQREAGPRVRGWLAALGRFEALAALASLRFENPDWAFPVVAATENRYEAQALGHPLIRDGQRVANDVTLGPPGTFLLVTGSNMSGKSTLLRAIGINAVLAQAGGPVCAESLRMPPMTLATSILVEDSLAEGVSFFMAELQRIRRIVHEADRAHAEGGVLLYLLDEVLRGTNSYERQVAVRRVVLHLLKQGALGAVSTHDLQLAEVPEIAATFVPVHFRETLHPGEDPPMTFDYQMHPGVATTVNALKLMELVGLGVEEI
ncbi:MAG TPA: DNA mismatch repair protein MutS [Thermoanaerobaculia bacterium]|nr:DNA mismatch repair protein MutS [Thermoanaerobaculia bacterium]